MKAAFYSDFDADDKMDITEIYDYITVTHPEKQIEIDVVVFNTNTGTAKNTWKFVNSTHPDGREYSYSNTNFHGKVSVQSEEISNGMKGYLLAITDISLLNSNCSLGYVIRGKEGQTVTSYLESTSVFDTEVPGCGNHITHDGTINSIACGTEPIIVGAYNTANSYKGADGNNYTFQDAF